MPKLKRMVKGSAAAKRHLATLRAIKSGKLGKRKHTYKDGLYSKKTRKKGFWGWLKS